MKLGIVGLPNVGKSTLFNAITSTKNAEAANYPFCTIEPNSGIVAVPDKRLDKLAEIWQTNKKTPAIVEFVDIAGLVKGASQGAGLGNKFLGHIRECDAIVHVVRCFDDDNIIHVVEDVTKAEAVDPIADIDAIDYELILSDLEVVQNRAGRMAKAAKSGNNKGAAAEAAWLQQLADHLATGTTTRSSDFAQNEAAQQTAARNAVEAQTAEDIGAVGQHDHLPVGVGRLAHPEIRHPDIGDRMTMAFEIARRPTARRRESQFAAEPFADAGLRSPRVEGEAARSRSGLGRHDILAPFERVRQVKAHGGFTGADRLRRGKPANNQQQPSHPPPYANSSLTLAEISLPSARPASLFEATPITLPISFIDVAPTSAITALTSAASSSAVSCLGRNS